MTESSFDQNCIVNCRPNVSWPQRSLLGPMYAWRPNTSRVELYEWVMALPARGGTMKGIGRELSIDHRTVRNFITAGAFLERAPRAPGPTPLDPYLSYIEERIAQGCCFPELIWLELKQRCYRGSRAAVRNCVIRLPFPQGKKFLFQVSVRHAGTRSTKNCRARCAYLAV